MEFLNGTAYGFYWGEDMAKKEKLLRYLETHFPNLCMRGGVDIRVYLDSSLSLDGLIVINESNSLYALAVRRGHYHDGHLERNFSPVVHIDINYIESKPQGNSKIRFVFG
jgi:hypothetical protein